MLHEHGCSIQDVNPLCGKNEKKLEAYAETSDHKIKTEFDWADDDYLSPVSLLIKIKGPSVKN